MLTRALIAVSMCLLFTGPAMAQELIWETIEHDGVERGFGWYAGVGIGDEPAPLVLLLHGGGGSSDQLWNGDDGQTWRRLADDHRFVVLVPQGRSDSGNNNAHHWNDCRSNITEPEAASDADDIGFLRSAASWATERWHVDLDRVYVTGPSNGGMMSYRLAMEASNLLAAAAPIIANLPDPSECADPTRAVPILIMNGTEDPLMPWDGGCVANARCERVTVGSTAEAVAFWVEINATVEDPICTDLPDVDPSDGSTISVCTYTDGTAGSEVVLYRVDGGGHAVPGPDPLPWWYQLIVGPKNHDISAPVEIWAFFDRHRRTEPAPRPSATRAGG